MPSASFATMSEGELAGMARLEDTRSESRSKIRTLDAGAEAEWLHRPVLRFLALTRDSRDPPSSLPQCIALLLSTLFCAGP